MKRNSSLVQFATPALMFIALEAGATSPSGLTDACIDATFALEGFPAMTPHQIHDYLDAQDTKAAVEELVKKPHLENAWLTMKIPHLHPRTLGLYESIWYSFRVYRSVPKLGTTPEDWLRSGIDFYSASNLKLLKETPVAPDLLGHAKTPAELKNYLLAPRQADETGLGTLLKKNPAIASFACADIDLLHHAHCLSAFKYAYRNLYELGDTSNLANGWLVDLFLDNSAAEGAFRLVQRMLLRIQNQDFESASLIEDAYSSFKQAGVPESESNKTAETFLLLGLIHGQLSWESYKLSGLIQPYNAATLLAAYEMSMLSATLDSMVQKASLGKKIYSAPSDFEVTCDNGKPYHFLVPWYIARRLNDLAYSNNIAIQIPFAFDWIYQALSQSRGRSPVENLRQSFDSPLNQSHRLDLLYSVMGAFKGSHPMTKPVNTDMTALFNSTQDSVPEWARPPQKVSGNLNTPLDVLQILNLSDARFSGKQFLKKFP